MTEESGDVLPEWTKDHTPVSHAVAARLLGVSARQLYAAVKRLPHYESRGVKRVYYPEHIRALRAALDAESRGQEEKPEGVKSTLRVEPYEHGFLITGRLNGKTVRRRYPGRSREFAEMQQRVLEHLASQEGGEA